MVVPSGLNDPVSIRLDQNSRLKFHATDKDVPDLKVGMKLVRITTKCESEQQLRKSLVSSSPATSKPSSSRKDWCLFLSSVNS